MVSLVSRRLTLPSTSLISFALPAISSASRAAARPGNLALPLPDGLRGGAAAKVDFALRGPVPWQAPGCDRAGTLHVVGTRAQAADAEAAVAAGRHAERPYVLAIQPGVVDPSRAPEGAHTFYTYAHVPNGSTVDVAWLPLRDAPRHLTFPNERRIAREAWQRLAGDG